MGERCELRGGKFAQEAVVEAHDTHILRHISSGAGELFHEPVGNFIILTDDCRAGTEIPVDKIRKESGCLFFLKCGKLGGGIPADAAVVPCKISGGTGGGKADIAFDPGACIAAEDAGNLCVLPVDQMLRQQRGSGKVVLCDDSPRRKIFISVMQKDRGELTCPQFLVQVQIGIWQGTFHGINDQSAQRERLQLLKDLTFFGNAGSGQKKGDDEAFLYKRYLKVISQSGVGIVAVSRKKDGDLVAGCIRVKTGGISTAALTPLDQSLGLKYMKCLTYRLTADTVEGAEFLFGWELGCPTAVLTC